MTIGVGQRPAPWEPQQAVRPHQQPLTRQEHEMVYLGDKVKDTVSGFSGIAVARHEYLNGCSRITVQPAINKDGTLPDPQTFDEPQLEVKKSGKIARGPTNIGGPEKYMPTPKAT